MRFLDELRMTGSGRSKTSDRITNMPENIIENILGRLPIQDFVRSSVLSRNWRYKWTKLPDLVFDLEHIVNEDEAIKIIYRVLFQHNGPVHKFSVSIKTMKNYSDIDQWVRFLSVNGISEFNLKVINGGGGTFYRIHSSLFSCVNLRQLKLQSCIIIPSPPPPTLFNGFNYLTCLRLEYVTFNNDGFEHLVAKCPQLKDLHVCRVDGIDILKIHHAPKLESLYFCCNLIKFIYLKNTPSLLYATLYHDNPNQLPHMDHRNLHEINLIGLSNVRKLVVGSYFMQFLADNSVRKSLPSTHNHLREVQFFKLMFEDIDCVSSALDLIESCPNLDRLVVTIGEYTKPTAAAAQLERVTKCLEERSGSIGSFKSLTYVEMNKMTGLEPEIQFIKLILSNSPMLNQMKIQPVKTVNCKDAESKILRELLRFSRASVTAEIIYS